MKHILKIQEHIMDNIGSRSSSHIISKISQIKPNDLISGGLYENLFPINSGKFEGETLRTIQKFLKKDNKSFIFRVMKIYTPEIAKELDINRKDLIRVSEEDLINYHPLT